MGITLCFSPLISLNTIAKPALSVGSCNTGKPNWNSAWNSRSAAFEPIKATVSDSNTKRNSILCTDCEGNGCKKCTQCGGTGVNSVDHFNGQFKAGGLCWLCRGKKEILCGNCNGAGFIGGFLSTQDE